MEIEQTVLRSVISNGLRDLGADEVNAKAVQEVAHAISLAYGHAGILSERAVHVAKFLYGDLAQPSQVKVPVEPGSVGADLEAWAHQAYQVGAAHHKSTGGVGASSTRAYTPFLFGVEKVPVPGVLIPMEPFLWDVLNSWHNLSLIERRGTLCPKFVAAEISMVMATILKLYREKEEREQNPQLRALLIKRTAMAHASIGATRLMLGYPHTWRWPDPVPADLGLRLKNCVENAVKSLAYSEIKKQVKIVIREWGAEPSSEDGDASH